MSVFSLFFFPFPNRIQAKLPESQKGRISTWKPESITVTKTPFNSYNVVTCTMKEHAQCQLEPAFQAFIFNLVFSPLLSLYPQYQAQELLDLKRTDILESQKE